MDEKASRQQMQAALAQVRSTLEPRLASPFARVTRLILDTEVHVYHICMFAVCTPCSIVGRSVL
jgi:hypothetical protein